MEIFSSKNGIRVINDSYNANPDSASAAIEVLRNMSCRGRRVLILADMMELGEYSEIGHRSVGEKAAQSKADILITIGEKAEDIRQGALDNGMKEENIYCFSSNGDAISHLGEILMPYDTVLIKGSRVMKLEEIADSLRERGFTKDE
ncbi:UDP-N-acetylmuramoyl-tripeptide--D-alanyl-D-alanine ligase [bioreactor metagenome]|uniref:UDP-N-acetylmuramoyl-tripeptide--D-alanyl-D-alanine ligase n=1 Tax=bioreactor metagenome TaxID=1076179 RepID=A0A645HA53_9ZZZZ